MKRCITSPVTSALFPLLFFICSVLSGPQAVRAEDPDMEAEFFQDLAAMEKEYRDYEREAFEQYRSEVEAMWNDFVSSTKKDWVEYSPDKTGRSRVDFENGDVTVEVLVPEKKARRDPDVVRKRLAEELERLVEDRGKTRDYPLPVKPPQASPAVEEKLSAALSPEDGSFPEPSSGGTLPEKIPASRRLEDELSLMEGMEEDRKVEPSTGEDLLVEISRDDAPVLDKPSTGGSSKDPSAEPPERKMIPPLPLLPVPVLENQLKDRKGEVVTPKSKEAFAQEVVDTRPVQEKVIPTKKGKMVKASVTFPLVPDHLRIRAERHLRSVRRHAGRFRVDVPLAFAVMHTESYFNPKAKSPVPAYGLMQLVPRSGGRDAYRHVYGQDKILGPDYLYVPDNNIELGCAYLGLLQNRYFKNVKDPQNALYCAIASYNTGMGNLSRAVTGKKRLAPAVDRINTLKPDEFYSRLLRDLPYRETQDYLKKVRKRMDFYQEWK
jgi:hypothetical protein